MTDYTHGPELLSGGGVRFRLWAPTAGSVALEVEGKPPQPLERKEGGWFTGIDLKAGPNTRYRFLINGELRVPDPASRFQPEDVDGPSLVLDHAAFNWPKGNWHGRPWEEAVVYELHVGTFSPSGDYAGVMEKLDHLAALGVTAIELMPLADFAGRRGWGYDGVLPYAPEAAYGSPDELKRLIAAAHARGLMVFLDVVYNHFGPSGNYLHAYAKNFFTEKHHTPWGAAIDFEDETSRPVREFFIQNALYWLTEYRFDGLRFDAVHAIADSSHNHFLYELAETVRARLPEERHVHLILENDNNEARYLKRGEEGKPRHFTAQWNDDIHHVLHVLLTGETGGYYGDYKEKTLERLGRCLAQGFAYQGETSAHREGKPRGEPSAHLPPTAFVSFLQNHDQIGNRAMGERLTTLVDEDKLTLGAAIMLLSPQVPMLYMGEEWWTEKPFLYFCDFTGELANAVREGRRKEFASFAQFSDPTMRERIPDPNAESTFLTSKLDWSEPGREPWHKRLAFTQRLLALRHQHVVPMLGKRLERSLFDVIDGRALEVRWQFEGGAVLRMVANFSANELSGLAPLPGEHIWGSFHEPLPAWKCAWSVGSV